MRKKADRETDIATPDSKGDKTGKFTERSVGAIKPQNDRIEIWEPGRKGFGVRVYPSGKKSWVFLYRYHGKARRMTLGEFPHLSLAKAHVKHAEAAALLREGIDPGRLDIVAKEVKRQAPTVDELAEEYLEKWARPRKRSWREDQRILTKYVSPAWGWVKAQDVRRRDVIRMLDDLAARAPVQANRVQSVVRKMFNWAVTRDVLKVSPCHQVKAPAKETRKERVLSAAEIRDFWQGIEAAQMSDSVRRALKLILVTAQRPGEVIGASWSEIAGGWWTLPGGRTKNKMSHRVPLSPIAVQLFGNAGQGAVFPSPKTSKAQPIHVNALSHALRTALQAAEPGAEPALKMAYFTPHDLRRTAASQMTSAGIPRLVVSKILNHAEPGVTAIYDRHSYDRETKQALEAWARRLDKILKDKPADNVIEFRKS